MALIPCPDCKAQVSDQAPTCPSCGRQFRAWGYMPASPTHQPKRGTSNIGLVIIVVALIGVATIGVLAVVAIFGVRKFVANAKTAEAKNSLGQMGKDITTAYEESASRPGGRRQLCPSASQPVPADKSMVRGKKYQSTSADWMRDGPDTGFGCMKFEMTMPQYYQYEYQATADTFVVRAHGDLNGDGVVSTFELHGAVTGDHVVIEPQIIETNPEE